MTIKDVGIVILSTLFVIASLMILIPMLWGWIKQLGEAIVEFLGQIGCDCTDDN